MKRYTLYITTLLFWISVESMALNYPNESYQPQTSVEKKKKGKKNKNGSYKPKSHWLKKIIQGKRYCNCP